jgi:parvulin-like peptidyl-prolyl isomerase
MAQSMFRPAMNATYVALFALAACGGSHKDEGQTGTASPPPAAAAAANAAASTVPVPSHETAAATPMPPPGGATPGKAAHHTVATVNGKPIPEEKVYALYRMNRSTLAQRGRTLTDNDEKVLRAQSLQIAVADELFFQDAQKKGIKVTSAEVDEAVKQLKTRVGSEENYKKFVADSGFSDIDVRKELERNLRTEAYRKSLFAGKQVSDDQVKKFYDENAPKGMFNVPEQVHVQFIVLRVNETDPASVRAEAKTKAEEAAKRAAAGEEFTALAKQYSQDPSAERGGDIGLVPRGVMFPKFDEIAFALAPGGVSPAFETPRGFGVVKVLEKKPPATRTYNEVKEALKLDMGRLVEQDALKAKANELAKGAAIEVLDASYIVPPQGAPPEQAAKKP